MSLYRNLGPISYHSQSSTCQIFTTQTHWIIQSYYTQSTPQQLENLCQSYNKMIGKQAMQMYSQKGKVASIIMDRSLIREFDWTVNYTADFMCSICQALVGTFQAINIENVPINIERSMFFRVCDQIMYLYMPVQCVLGNQNAIKGKNNICLAIVSFIQSNSSFLCHLSNKLLLTKLKKCQKLKQIKQQLQYFQKIYEVGTRKVHKQLKQNQQAYKIERPVNKKTSHRTYRKRSEQIHEPILVKKNYSSSQHRSNSKKSLTINNFYKGSTSHHHSTCKNSFFSHRNKLTDNATGTLIQNNGHFYQTGRLQSTSTSKFIKSNKGLFQQAKAANTKRRNKKGLQSCSNVFFDQTLSNYKNNQGDLKGVRDEKDRKQSVMQLTNSQLLPPSNNLINFKTETMQCCDNNYLKQKIEKNIKMWKEKRNKNKALCQVRICQAEQKVKQQTEQKDQKLDSSGRPKAVKLGQRDCQNQKDYMSIGTDIERKNINTEKQNIKPVQFTNKRYVEEKQQTQQYKNHIKSAQEGRKQAPASKEDFNIHENILDELQEITLIPVNKKIKDNSKVPRQQKTKQCQQQNEVQQMLNTLSHNTQNNRNEKAERQKNNYKQEQETRQKMAVNVCKTIKNQEISEISKESNRKQQEQKSKLKQLDKQKTTRKNINPNQIIQQALLKNTKTGLERINLIGECVMKMQNQISNLSNGDKYLWQFPAFIFYKEFYIRRLQIQEKLRQESCSKRLPGYELKAILTQLSQQNIQAKQSLAKLLKVTLKKLKKYDFDAPTIEQSKKFLNLDLSVRWTKRVDDTIRNFIAELNEIRKDHKQLTGYLIQVCDCYSICKGEHVDIERRKGLQLERYEDEKIIQYYNERINKIV